jgi:asparagine synthetase B (glutamine-hydrolysing)
MNSFLVLLNGERDKVSFYENEIFKGIYKNDKSQFNDKYHEIIAFHPSSMINVEQQFMIDDILLVCNGDIYNHKELFNEIQITPKSSWTCEIIIHLYLKFGFPQILNYLDGEFSFVLYDMRINSDDNNKIFVARDVLGARPLYQFAHKPTCNECNKYFYGFSSESKTLFNIDDKNHFHCKTFNDKENKTCCKIIPFLPGTYSYYSYSYGMSQDINWKWVLEQSNISYAVSVPHIYYNQIYTTPYSYELTNFKNYLTDAVNKRCNIFREKNIGCILSGDIESNILAVLIYEYCKINDCILNTFSIGFENSEHLRNTKMVANFLHSTHTEIIITKEDMFQTIPGVIYVTECYDSKTVFKCIESYYLSKYISKNCDTKVLFTINGFNISECKLTLTNSIESDIKIRQMLKEIHYFNEKCIKCNGIEPLTPYLDNMFLHYILSQNRLSQNQLKQVFLNQVPDYFSLNTKIIASKHFILQKEIADYLNFENGCNMYLPIIETEEYFYKQIFQDIHLHTIDSHSFNPKTHYIKIEFKQYLKPLLRYYEVFNKYNIYTHTLAIREINNEKK